MRKTQSRVCKEEATARGGELGAGAGAATASRTPTLGRAGVASGARASRLLARVAAGTGSEELIAQQGESSGCAWTGFAGCGIGQPLGQSLAPADPCQQKARAAAGCARSAAVTTKAPSLAERLTVTN